MLEHLPARLAGVGKNSCRRAIDLKTKARMAQVVEGPLIRLESNSPTASTGSDVAGSRGAHSVNKGGHMQYGAPACRFERSEMKNFRGTTNRSARIGHTRR